MKVERWQEVKERFNAVLELEATQRASYLEEIGSIDPELRAEVESLLSSHNKAGDFLDGSPAPAESLAPGARVGEYDIVELVGAGGMGEVYRARDKKLDRDVAIKVLPRFFADDPDRVRRFGQEACAAASLNHPNILHVNHVGGHNTGPYMVMEFLVGETMRDRLRHGALGLRATIDLGVQMGEGLAAAHEKGIVHRDLKPENIFITTDGIIKILDFGLARLTHVEPIGEGAGTRPVSDTDSGLVVGTVGYMSPEQVRGQRADQRSDIFSLGAILYEMLSGQRAFHREIAAETMTAILRDEPPDLHQLDSSIPRPLARIVQHCLEKNPAVRFQSARDICFDLKAHRHGIDQSSGLRPQAHPAAVHRDMLAVLPFHNLNEDPEQDFFSDGMTEEMITQLSRLDPHHLGVIARTSSMLYKKTAKNAQQIGRELRVDYILEGSIRRSNDHIRITAQLIRASDQTHAWSEQYDRTFDDVLNLQTEVAEHIARSLALELLPDFQRLLLRSYKTDPGTFDNYLRGRYHWNQRSEEGFRRALEYFYKVVEQDPGYAPAYAGIADTYNIFALYGWAPAHDAYQRAKSAAIKALQIDDRLAEAHTSLGWARIQHDWDAAAAEVEHLRALELNPNYATGHQWYALFLAETSRFEEALAEVDRSLELDPLSTAINAHKGWILYFARRFEEAIEHLKETVKMDPSFALAVYFLGLAQEQAGQFKEALSSLQLAVELSGNHPGGLSGLVHTYALSGNLEQASVIQKQLLELVPKRHVSPYFIAVGYVALGDNDRAFEFLEQSFQEHSGWMAHLAIEPQLDPVRSDPRFGELMQRVGMYATGQQPLARAVAAAASAPLRMVQHQTTDEANALAPGVSENYTPRGQASIEPALDETDEFEYVAERDAALFSKARRLKSWHAVAVLLIVAIVAIVIWLIPPSGKTLLLVRPLENLGGSEQVPFVRGMTEELTAELAHLNPKQVGVMAPTTAVYYTGRSVGQIRKDLKVNYVIEGSVLRTVDNRVRITIDLIQAKDETHVWAKSYEEDAKDIIGWQRRVATAIAEEIKVRLGPAVPRVVQVSPDAYEAFLRGRYFWNKRGPEAVQKSIHYFQEAIKKDPNYARPYAGLADAFSLLGSVQSGALPPDAAFPKARDAALRSIELDPNLAEPHASLGYIKLVYEREPEAAKQEFSRALELDPNYVTAHQWLGQYYLVTGNLQEAMVSVRRAYELERVSLPVNLALAEAYYFARDFDLAIEQSQKALDLDSTSALAHYNLGRAYEMKGMHKEALEEFYHAREASPSPATLVPIGYVHARAGQKSDTKRVLAELTAASKKTYVPALYFAVIFIGMNDLDHAFAALERAKAEHCDYIGLLLLDPMADPLRRDPRFEKLLRKE